MLSKILLLSALALLIAKLVFRVKFRELGRRVDRAVTLMLVLIVLAYGGHVLWWIVSGR